MAKSAKRGGKASGVERVVVGAAENLGLVLGTLARQVESWTGQRDQLVKQLQDVQGTAGSLLKRLSTEVSTSFKRGRQSTAPAPQAPARKKRRFSATTRRKMASAQTKRWAKLKASKKK